MNLRSSRGGRRSGFGTGFISSLTNPKTGLFFLTLLPPFLPVSPSLLDHGLMVVTVSGCILVYGVMLSTIAGRASHLLINDSAPDVIDTVSGIVLIALGITVIAL